MRTVVIVALVVLAGVAMAEDAMAVKERQVIRKDTELSLGTYKDRRADKCTIDDPYHWDLLFPDGTCVPMYDAATGKCTSVTKVTIVARPANTVRVRYYATNDEDCLRPHIDAGLHTLNVCRNHRMLTLIKSA